MSSSVHKRGTKETPRGKSVKGARPGNLSAKRVSTTAGPEKKRRKCEDKRGRYQSEDSSTPFPKPDDCSFLPKPEDSTPLSKHKDFAPLPKYEGSTPLPKSKDSGPLPTPKNSTPPATEDLRAREIKMKRKNELRMRIIRRIMGQNLKQKKGYKDDFDWDVYHGTGDTWTFSGEEHAARMRQMVFMKEFHDLESYSVDDVKHLGRHDGLFVPTEPKASPGPSSRPDVTPKKQGRPQVRRPLPPNTNRQL